MSNKNTLSKKGSKIGEIFRMREVSLLFVLILLCAVIQLRNNQFLTANVINGIFKNYAYTMVLAFGMMLVLLIGGIDISVGATLALSGMTSCIMMKEGILTSALSVYAVSTIIGVVCGLLIGLVIAKGRVIPIIATLGFQYIYRGLTYAISDSDWVGTSEMSKQLKNIVYGVNLYTVNNTALCRIECRHKNLFKASLSGFDYHRQRTVYTADVTVERKLTDKGFSV
jgi:rhamnose transport system permease protein